MRADAGLERFGQPQREAAHPPLCGASSFEGPVVRLLPHLPFERRSQWARRSAATH